MIGHFAVVMNFDDDIMCNFIFKDDLLYKIIVNTTYQQQ